MVAVVAACKWLTFWLLFVGCCFRVSRLFLVLMLMLMNFVVVGGAVGGIVVVCC